MTKQEFIANYMNKRLKKNNSRHITYGMTYLNWFSDEQEKAERLYKAYKKRQTKNK